MSFIIYGLPRSRTFWLSKFLTYGDCHCGHEEIIHVRSIDDIRCWFNQHLIGTAETAAAGHWRLIQGIDPNIKTVVIRRDPEDVLQSLLNTNNSFNLDVLKHTLRMQNAKLDQIEHRIPNVLSIPYHDLDTKQACKTIFEYCTQYPFDEDWWIKVSKLNLQMDLHKLFKYMAAFKSELDRTTRIMKQHNIALMGKKDRDLDEISIKEESFSEFIKNKTTFKTPYALVDYDPNMINELNDEVFMKLEQKGNLQTILAKSNGKAFGYLITIIAPSLMNKNIMCGHHQLFYASKDFSGLGTKMMNTANELLKQKGITEIHLRSGIHKDWGRLESMFKRLGATSLGNNFILNI